jgi:hypothetical protein
MKIPEICRNHLKNMENSFQVKKTARTTCSVNFKENEIDEINEKINAIAEKDGVVFSGFQALVLHLLNRNQTEIEAVKDENNQENTVILGENQVIINLLDPIKEEFDKNPEIEIENQILVLIEKANAQPKEVEVLKEVERPLAENEMILPVSAAEKVVLAEIISRRQRKYKFEVAPTTSDIVRQIVFSKPTLFNWHGEYYTGLEIEDFKKIN